MISTADGKKTETQGTYLTVLKRQADGKWLIAQQVWTEAPPLEQRRPIRSSVWKNYATMKTLQGTT